MNDGNNDDGTQLEWNYRLSDTYIDRRKVTIY